MKAIALESFEGGPRLLELPTPQIGPKEVLIRVHASSVNGIDSVVASGMAKGMMEYQFPVVLGRDLAGVIEGVGPEVTRYSIGDEVFGYIAKSVLHGGSWAEYVSAPEDMFIAAKPKRLDFTSAAAIPLAGSAALAGIEALAPARAAKVLIIGATGGVGSYAVQMAARRGATVIATGYPEDEAYLRDLGASEVVDYSRDVALEIRRRYPEGIQGLLDLVHFGDSFGEFAALVVPGGRAASSLGAANVEDLAARGVTATNFSAKADPETLGRLAELADSGELRTPLQQVYRLEEAGKALEDFRGRTRGKIGIES